ncbi:DUF2157 domain-containing protein [Mesorhizobium marinum]|uniref:DUF2157 domain-containing protein n=1 Tax=Mesorhizobium marinum TaxID=3228790 RepID=UPI003467E7A3
MASYATRVRTDAARWAAEGIIDAKAAAAIVADVEARDRRSLSFGSILAVMAALLFGAAILIFVAANWEAIPRLARVGALFAVIAFGYVGGAVLKVRDHAAIAEAVWLVAAAAFGGSIALIGQMYHLSGDETDAILTWCAGTAVAAAALRSGPLTIAAVTLAAAWMFLREVDFWRDTTFPYHFLAIAAVLWLISCWTGSARARHLLLLSLVLYGVLLAAETDILSVAPVLAAISAAVFGVAIALPGDVEKVARIDGMLPVHALLGFLTGMALTQFEIGDTAGPGFAIAAAATLAGIVAAVVLAGRESRGLRWIAYVGFAFELCLIYVVMIEGMLGTAGFFLVAGLILGLFALVVIRIEKRMAAPHGLQGASS